MKLYFKNLHFKKLHFSSLGRTTAFLAFCLLISVRIAHALPTDTDLDQPATGTSTVTELSASLSLGEIQGDFAFGPGIRIERPTDWNGLKFSLGAETFFFYSTYGVTTQKTTQSAWACPLLLTGNYHFQSDLPNFQAYFSVKLGPVLERINSSTGLYLGILLSPGVVIGKEQKWFVEIPFGALLRGLAVMPSVGLNF